jgi:hypothetical protein
VADAVSHGLDIQRRHLSSGDRPKEKYNLRTSRTLGGDDAYAAIAHIRPDNIHPAQAIARVARGYVQVSE